jgi:hypothetical protein
MTPKEIEELLERRVELLGRITEAPIKLSLASDLARWISDATVALRTLSTELVEARDALEFQHKWKADLEAARVQAEAELVEARKALEDEREACAQIADTRVDAEREAREAAPFGSMPRASSHGGLIAAEDIAILIRDRARSASKLGGE